VPPLNLVGWVRQSQLCHLVTDRLASTWSSGAEFAHQRRHAACVLILEKLRSERRRLTSRDVRGVRTDSMTTSTPVRVIAALYPSIPQAIEVYSRFREPKQVTCPEKCEPTTVQVDAEMAAATAAVGVPGLRIIRCTQWPRVCGRGCLEQLG